MMEYTIKPLEGFADKIGELAFTLEHTRAATLNDIAGLKQNELDYLDRADDNSIGALLAHIGAIEKVHQLISFEGRDFTGKEWEQWGTAVELGDKARAAIQGYPLDYYLKGLEQIRQSTLRSLRSKDDSWLYQERCWPNGIPYNNYYLWFHVMEDEIKHRGQIRIIKRRLQKG
ncbi:DinB family protein [Planococcus shenhongbingii]|uniref:DinB family protein n=1 Tax=Planococcus shenhongbingii TaxID=3058398 RepID=UPI00260E1051|nr:DinB family protein [Planococcus sp. N016]WKA58451.1 DinB family protein [Planococcus sp. N016]